MQAITAPVDQDVDDVRDGVAGDEESVTALEHDLRTLFDTMRQWQHRQLLDGARLDQGTYVALAKVEHLEPVRLQDLAAAMGLDASTVSRHTTALEGVGLLRRECDPQDRRARRISLTDQGRAALTEDRSLRRGVVRRIIGSWTAEDRDRLHRLFSQLNGELGSLLGVPATPATQPPATQELPR